MAQCLADTAFAGVECGGSTPGAYDEVWIGNRSELTVTEGTGADLGYVTDITFDSGAGWYRFKCKKGSVVFRESMQGGEEDLVAWQPEIEFMLASNTQAARNAVNSLGGPDLVAVCRGKGDTFHIIGIESGARLVTNEASSAADAFGNQVIIRELNNEKKALLYFDTDVTTTLTALEGATIAS